MTKSSVSSVYTDLTKLLGDIGRFLDEQVKGGILKGDALLQAQKLIDRSKQQIERIDAVAPQNSDDYVIMHNGLSANETQNCPEEEEDHYALVVEASQLETIQKCVSDVSDLPASKIPRTPDVKSGILTYYRKNEWFFRRKREVFAAVFKGHLLVYESEKSEKPWFELDLTHYRGNELFNNKQHRAFEITNKLKVYHFIAVNEKDMEQWLSKINRLDCEHARDFTDTSEKPPRKPATIAKPKMLLQQRPIPDIPKVPRITSTTSAAYIEPDEGNSETSSIYAMPGESEHEQAPYCVMNAEDGARASNGGENDYDAYAPVAEYEETGEEDEGIYATAVPAPPSTFVRPARTSFVHRQSGKR